MHSFIKENKPLVAALLLPVVFAAFFMISKQATNISSEPPRHDLVLTDTNNYNDIFQIAVIEGRMSVKFIYPKRNDNGHINDFNAPQIFYVSAATLIAEPINLDLPDDARNPSPQKEGMSVDIPVAAFTGKTFSGAAISPDGYEAGHRPYRGGNLMTDIFANTYNDHNSMSLYKSGANISIKGLRDSYNLRVAGWVTDPHPPASGP